MVYLYLNIFTGWEAVSSSRSVTDPSRSLWRSSSSFTSLQLSLSWWTRLTSSSRLSLKYLQVRNQPVLWKTTTSLYIVWLSCLPISWNNTTTIKIYLYWSGLTMLGCRVQCDQGGLQDLSHCSDGPAGSLTSRLRSHPWPDRSHHHHPPQLRLSSHLLPPPSRQHRDNQEVWTKVGSDYSELLLLIKGVGFVLKITRVS